jgi:ABC-type bacteriocin/lantibiotic exporter with double-glycine peptidase domain
VILSFEKLLKLKIGEDFQNISGGEKQKIAIARALFRKPKILILDESTNSIDGKSENKIVNNLTSYKEILLLFVSHNVSLIKKFKNVIKLNKIRN